MGTFTSARRYVLHTFANTQSALMKKRVVAVHARARECPVCHGKRLRRESLSVTFAGLDIAEMSRLPLKRLARAAAPVRRRHARAPSSRASIPRRRSSRSASPRICVARLARAARPRARLSHARAQHADAVARRAAAAAARDAGALEPVRRRLRARRAVGRPASGRHRGAARGARSAEGVGQLAVRRRARARRDPPRRLDRRRRARPPASTAARSSTAARRQDSREVEASQTRRYLFGEPRPTGAHAARRRPAGCGSSGVTRNNLHDLDVDVPARRVHDASPACPARASRASSARRSSSSSPSISGTRSPTTTTDADELERARAEHARRRGSSAGMERDQAAGAWSIRSRSAARRARTSRPTPGLFDHVRKLFAATQGGARAALRRRPLLVQRREGPLRELRGRRLRDGRAAVPAERLRAVPDLPRRALQREDARDHAIADKNIADVLGMTVDAACEFFADEPPVRALARRAARGRPRLPAARPAGDRAVGRRSAAHQARDRAAARRSAATRSTSSTSRRPACIPPTSRS